MMTDGSNITHGVSNGIGESMQYTPPILSLFPCPHPPPHDQLMHVLAIAISELDLSSGINDPCTCRDQVTLQLLSNQIFAVHIKISPKASKVGQPKFYPKEFWFAYVSEIHVKV